MRLRPMLLRHSGNGKERRGEKKEQIMTKPEGSYTSPWTHNGAQSTMRNNSGMQEEESGGRAAQGRGEERVWCGVGWGGG